MAIEKDTNTNGKKWARCKQEIHKKQCNGY